MAFSAAAGPLRLELSQDCQDRAVWGGLAAFVRRWAEAQPGAGPRAELARSLVAGFSDYAGLPPAERRALVEQALARLEGDPLGPVGWDDSLTALHGVGPQRAQHLAQAGLQTVGDLLCYYPAAYEDRSQVRPLSEARHREPLTARVTVHGPGEAQYRQRPPRAQIPARDASGECRLVWLNQPYLASQYRVGEALLVQGQARRYPSGLQILVQKAERVQPGEEPPPVAPVYALPEGVSQPWLRELIAQARQRCREVPPGLIPPDLAQRRGLASLAEALGPAHEPPDLPAAHAARERLVEEALFAMQVEMLLRRARQRRPQPRSRVEVGEAAAGWAAALPFALTGAQQRAVTEALEDLAADHPGHRLLHGEVGAGKTVVAGAALYAVARSGRQAVLMAPTELLAEQHHAVLSGLLRPLGLEVSLLTGSLPPAEAQARRTALAQGRVLLSVGTHALFQKGVSFADLALVVVDEQHRFGVRQRAELAAKGPAPNLLVMSATPIPRTLALTAYGDFDLSVLEELPPGRQPVFTQVMTRRERRKVYDTLAARVAQGERAFVVCPIIEAGRAAYLTDAERWFHRLQGEMPALRWGLVHGRLPAEQREAVMGRFRRGEVEVLVATSVVEVGVDVPEATLMVVEDAERFGLAQLHQLRGRVARASRPAVCFLVTASQNPEVLERLQIVERTASGFEIAQQDLERRGPGEVLGDRQHGYLDGRLLAVADSRLVLRAREDAQAVLAADPELDRLEHQPLRAHLARRVGPEEGLTL